MINWLELAANSLWIIGCSTILAALSYASWLASERKVKFKQALSTHGVRVTYHLGGVLFCTGLAILGNSWIESGLWVLLGIGILAHLKWGS